MKKIITDYASVLRNTNGWSNCPAKSGSIGSLIVAEQLIRDTLEQKGKVTTDVSNDTFRKKVEARLFRNRQKSQWNEVLRAAATNTEWKGDKNHKPFPC
jgi:hypothetical protein